MKNNKTIVGIITIAVIALTTFIVVSCNKDAATHETNTTPAMTQTKTRGGTTLEQLNQSIIEFWDACDEAFCDDTALFMSICRANDYARFYQLTGITAAKVATIDSLTAKAVQDYDQQHQHPVVGTGAGNNVNPCTECTSSVLLRLGGSIKDMRDFFNTNNISDPIPIMGFFDGSISDWLRACLSSCDVYYNYQGMQDSLSMCQDACYMYDLYLRAVEHYNALEPNFE